MSTPSIFKRAAEIAKSLTHSEKNDQAKRIEFAKEQVVRRVKQKRKRERDADYAFMSLTKSSSASVHSGSLI